MKYSLSELTEVIRNRRTIYPEHYSSRKVHREIVSHVLTNAIWAPNHGMTQPWRFKVFIEGGVQKLADFLPELYTSLTSEAGFSQKTYDKLSSRTKASSVVIAICHSRDVESRIPEIEEIEAIACAVQNMFLTCTAYGVGAFWSTPQIIQSAEMKSFLGIEPSDNCLGLFYMGYPEGEWPSGHRKPLEYVTEWIEEE